MKIRLGMKNVTIGYFCALCDGKQIGNSDSIIEYVCTDSREADEKTLFVVSVGERVDGHNYMLSAAKNGCRYFLCQRVPEELYDSGLDFSAVVVKDSIKALAQLFVLFIFSICKRE